MSTSTNETTNSTQNERVVPIGKLWRVGLIAAVAAASVNLVYFFVTKSVFDIPYIIMRGPSGPSISIDAPIIIIFNVVPAIGATILLAVLGRLLSRPFRAFWIISVGVFLISFMLPLGLPSSVETSTKIGLSLMHIPAGAIILGVLTRRGRER
ncbi:MAG: hypothetical protein IH859_03095, partial [Chloroflexi bacterium]|nr:hypothetical protein [Chloroflexota bacterium]